MRSLVQRPTGCAIWAVRLIPTGFHIHVVYLAVVCVQEGSSSESVMAARWNHLHEGVPVGDSSLARFALEETVIEGCSGLIECPWSTLCNYIADVRLTQ